MWKYGWVREIPGHATNGMQGDKLHANGGGIPICQMVQNKGSSGCVCPITIYCKGKKGQ